MSSNAKRPRKPGAMSDLVVDVATSAPAMLAAMVHDQGGAVSISFEVLAKVADEILLNVTTTPEGVRLSTTLKPIIRPQLEVPEGPAGVADLGQPPSEAWPIEHHKPPENDVIEPEETGIRWPRDRENEPDPELGEREDWNDRPPQG